MFLAFFNKKQPETTLQIETRRQCGPKGKNAGGGRRREERTEEKMLMDAAGDAHLHRRRSFTHTEAFTHRSFYTEKCLH